MKPLWSVGAADSPVLVCVCVVVVVMVV
eukprot:COSAG04_NODE_33010_length_185_cov_14.697674_1_plen_27_part_01